MSRAFTKEDTAPPPLPDRPLSPHPNLVTRRGLALIDAELARHRGALQAASAADDRDAVAGASRELRYWTARRASARLAEPEPGAEEAVFGTAVRVRRARDGAVSAYRVVGEDEADPAAGRISWVSPVARALRGAAPGDLVALPGGEVEVLAVDPTPEPPPGRDLPP